MDPSSPRCSRIHVSTAGSCFTEPGKRKSRSAIVGSQLYRPIGARHVQLRIRFVMRFSKSAVITFLLMGSAATVSAAAQTVPSPVPAGERANLLRGEYGPLRANNDLLSYHLDIRV